MLNQNFKNNITVMFGLKDRDRDHFASLSFKYLQELDELTKDISSIELKQMQNDADNGLFCTRYLGLNHLIDMARLSYFMGEEDSDKLYELYSEKCIRKINKLLHFEIDGPSWDFDPEIRKYFISLRTFFQKEKYLEDLDLEFVLSREHLHAE